MSLSVDYVKTPDGSPNPSVKSLPPPYPEVEKAGQVNLGFQSDDSVIVCVDDGEKKREPVVVIEQDPWDITDVYVELKPWGELTTCGKIRRVLWEYIGRLLLLIFFLYMFICSLDFLSNAFRLIGGKAAGSIFSDSSILSNPVAGLMIGVLATVLFQSSSTTTSIVVSMVGSHILDVKSAIPIVMGANIGTSVTNTIVSMGQITNSNDFRRAFAGATIHDMFNWLTVIILLPLEVATGYLFRLSETILNSMDLSPNEAGDQDFLKVVTEPFTKLIIQLDKSVIEDIAYGIPEAMNKSMIKLCCEKGTVSVERLNISESWNFTYMSKESICLKECQYLFHGVAESWGDTIVGVILLVLALVILCFCLFAIVRTLNALLKGKISLVIKKFVNSNLPGKLSFLTGYIAIIIGAGMTFLVQSSSIFTSAITPLIGIGIITIKRAYPLTLGSNIGTTTTSILAALAQNAEDIPVSLQISLCHLFFNISGILIFYPIPFMRFPVKMAKFLGNQTCKYRWFPLVYLISMFFLFPALVFGLSLLGWEAMAGVLVPVVVVIIAVIIIKVMQSKAPNCLPSVLRTWDFLPEPLRSLKPYDRAIKKLQNCCPCIKKLTSENTSGSEIATQDVFSTKL